ncbi:sigma-54 dependent transcriptional regulator [Roseomonas elaeocarpi]|uniref:Sigma 54-interacting transcriptional regulator n=1 Tax=Roseomonas elaeocarpi TaxID=907779 RepID=A0ABV6JSM7_9PROT
MPRVLIIGSLEAELGQAARIAQARGAKLAQAGGISAGIAHARAQGCDLVLCDVLHDVAWLVQSLENERIHCPVVACGRPTDAAAAVRAIQAGAKEFLPLPSDPDLIVALLQAVAEDGNAPVFRDPAMAAILARAETVARAEASVLITGESGTGKEVLARHIHAHSRRANGPFVALNCAALPETLLESELFGHEKGAFSGAVAARRGKFEQAEGGTLLLDEIGEMDIRLQAKILRVLQEREVDRLGGTAPVKVDVRILAATNRDLAAEVRAGRFREDLLFRLRVVALRIPPLRERPADILPIAEHYAARYAEANGFERRAFSAEAKAMLLRHPWPGNVRELENAVHRAVLLAGGDRIEAEAIELDPPEAPRGQDGVVAGPAAGSAMRPLVGADFPSPAVAPTAAPHGAAAPAPGFAPGAEDELAAAWPGLATGVSTGAHGGAPRGNPHGGSIGSPAGSPGALPAGNLFGSSAHAPAAVAAPFAAYAAASPFTAYAPPAPPAAPASGVAALVGRRMEDVERALILETLGHCLGNRTRAAEILGISIRTLRNKLHEYRAAGAEVPAVAGQVPFAALG